MHQMTRTHLLILSDPNMRTDCGSFYSGKLGGSLQEIDLLERTDAAITFSTGFGSLLVTTS
jgi:hypothetical protein